jgi:hypothetical protein
VPNTLPLHQPGAPADPVEGLHGHPTAGRPASLAASLEPLAVGREQVAALLSIGVATLDRWDAAGLLGPVGAKKAGRKLWSLAELRDWVQAGMPGRQEWLARRAATYAGGRPR